MPNHIHGIIILYGDEDGDGNNTGRNFGDGTVETRHALSLPSPQPPPQPTPPKQPPPQQPIGHHRFQNPGKNTISSIVGSYKSVVTIYANRLGYQHGWQRLYYNESINHGSSFFVISHIAI